MARRRTHLRLEQLEERIVPGIAVVGTWHSEDLSVTVTALDTEGAPDIDADDILVKFSGNRVTSVKLTGPDPMDGLALVFHGATKVGKIKDSRSGDPGDLAFIVSDSCVKEVNLKSGIEGYDANGMTVGGIDLPADIDGDGEADDPLALYISGKDSKDRALKGKFIARGAVGGDLVFEGHTGTIRVINGDLDGDVSVAGKAQVAVRDGDLNGDVESDDARISVKDGDLNGDVDVHGDAKRIKVMRGDGNGNITVDGRLHRYEVVGIYRGSLRQYIGGGNITGNVAADTVGSISSRGGDISGDITANGADENGWGIRSVGAHRGDITADIKALGGGTKKIFCEGKRLRFFFPDVYEGGTFSGRAFSTGPLDKFTALQMNGALLNALTVRKLTTVMDMIDSTTLVGYLYGPDFAFGGGDDTSNQGLIEDVDIHGRLIDSDIAAGATVGPSGFFGDGDDLEQSTGEIEYVRIRQGIEIGANPHGVIATGGTMTFRLGSAATELVEGQSMETSGLAVSII